MRALITLLLVATLITSPVLASDWNPIATKAMKSIALLQGSDATCTAFVIDAKREYVLTAAHCDMKDMVVDGIPTKVISKDVKRDLLVLEVKGIDRPALRLSRENPKVGDEVGSFGFGYNFTHPLFRTTHISATDIEEFPGKILTDTDFVPGLSGGPVIDAAGAVVMIVQAGNGSTVGVGAGAETIKSSMGRYFEKIVSP